LERTRQRTLKSVLSISHPLTKLTVAFSYEVVGISIKPIVQMGKLRLSEGKEFTQGHMAAK